MMKLSPTVERIIQYGVGVPSASVHPDLEDELAAELEANAARLTAAALALRSNAAVKRGLARFGYGPDAWRAPAVP